MKKYLFFGLLVAVIFSVSVVLAGKSDNTLVSAINDKVDVSIVIPEHAIEVADNVFSLGETTDVDGRMVQGFMFMHDDRRGNAKPDGTPGGGKGGGKKDGGGNKCYAFLAKGAKWKETEPYITGIGVDLTLIETSLDAWDSKVSFDIFGIGTSGTTDGADTISPDGKNEVEFVNLGPTNTIAYTVVWGIFSGPPGGRELVEWDAVFNLDYAWSSSGEAGKMDYQNIATHEFGHAVGLGHPDDSCTEETMYRYADYGETKKRTLEQPDIDGIQRMYGM